MKLNRRILQVGLILMVTTMLLCITFTYYVTLKKPVFLRYCIETEATSNQSDNYGNQVIQLQYITNRNDKRFISAISFKEAPEISFNVSETPPGSSTFYFFNNNTGQQNGTVIGRYSLRSIYLTQLNYFREEWSGEKELNTATVQFFDGSSMTVDIGRIILYSDAEKGDAFDDGAGTSSEIGTNSVLYHIKKDITILKVNSTLLGDLPEMLHTKIEGLELSKMINMKYQSGDTLRAVTTVDDTLINYENYDSYNIMPKLSYVDKTGRISELRIYNITLQRELYDDKELFRYLKERGAF